MLQHILHYFRFIKQSFFDGKPVLKVASQGSVANIYNDVDIDQLTKQLNEIQLFKALHEFDEKLSNQAKFLRNFMNLIQIMMLFIRASRQGL